MSVQQTRETLTAYSDSLGKRGPYGQFFADDITFTVMGTDTVVKGRVEVEQFIRFFHEQAFDAEPVVKRMYFEDGHAAVEFEFVGKHVAEFMGVAASGRHVELPYMAAYDVVGTKITALRLYMAMDQLMRLIGAGEAAEHSA
jgi:ketosteroid isomerase-like protein